MGANPTSRIPLSASEEYRKKEAEMRCWCTLPYG